MTPPHSDADEISALETQIRTTMRCAFKDMIDSVCQKPQLEEDDVEWIVTLCNELKFRLNNLTPSRTDLHARLDAAFDCDLLKQMLTHSAVEDHDIRMMVCTVFERIEMLCAPVQDECVKTTKESILHESNAFKCIGRMILEANDIISEIETLSNPIRERIQDTIDDEN